MCADVSSSGNTDSHHNCRLMLSSPSSAEQIKIMITIWPVQPVCVVWKHVFLRRPQRDNYCQLNYSACSPCVFWLLASHPLPLASTMSLALQPPPLFFPSLHRPNPPPPKKKKSEASKNALGKCLKKKKIKKCSYTLSPLWQKHHAGS